MGRRVHTTIMKKFYRQTLPSWRADTALCLFLATPNALCSYPPLRRQRDSVIPAMQASFAACLSEAIERMKYSTGSAISGDSFGFDDGSAE